MVGVYHKIHGVPLARVRRKWEKEEKQTQWIFLDEIHQKGKNGERQLCWVAAAVIAM